MPETRILEINLISAQGLKIPPSAKMHRMHTYAIAWVDPSSKLRSHLDRVGGENPTWNEKFIFRVPPSFIYGDTSAVQVEIYACGYIRDYLIGTVRYLLSSSSLVSSKTGAVIGTPAFSAVHIRRPSGRVHGVLNIAATVYESADFAAFDGMSAVCFRDLIGEKENDEKRRRERRLSWHPNLIRSSSKRSERSTTSSGGERESFDIPIEDSVNLSDGNDSTTSSSSSSTTTVFKDVNGVRLTGEVAGKKGVKSEGGRLLCGLMLHRRFSFCPSDQNIMALARLHGKQI
ncbi:putative C2 domain-containing protein [Helianthus annuus]|nr:putative C2 domain-containing protein [Helianthus annuus]KAJ0814562.1 putative C2 domain-containing protein [Helianthus annuus]